MALDRIAVVVLTWNYHRYTLECLQSLRGQTIAHTVYVVDNASTDGTPTIVAERFPDARVIVNRENRGFAGGNNIGLRAAFADGADAAFVLNNDTTLEPDALARLIEAAHAHADAGVLTPLILYAEPPHRVWFAGAVANVWTGRIFHQDLNKPATAVSRETRAIERTTGCAMLITRACYDCIGGFDESLFMYFEDVEYSLRARDAGFSLLLVPGAVIYHYVSASSRGTKPANAVYYGTRNGIITMDRLRPLPFPAAIARRFLMVGAMLLYLLRPPLALQRTRDVLEGYWAARRQRLGPRPLS